MRRSRTTRVSHVILTRGVVSKGRYRCTHGLKRIAAVAAICAAVAPTQSAAAASAITQADLQAATRSLGFLDSLQNRATITIAVVYGASVRDGKNSAAQTAGMLETMRGPGSSTIRSNIVPVEEVAQNTQQYDALYLMPGVAPNGGAIAEYVRRQHVVSISSDPACLNANCCVLMVQAGSGVSIVLDTGLANAVGAHFSSVFTMMVKRK